MGLLDFLSPALTTATQAAGAQAQGQVQASQLLRALQMQQAELGKLGAERRHLDAQSHLAERQAGVPMPGDPGYIDYEKQLHGGIKGAETEAETPGLVARAQQMLPVDKQKAQAESDITEGREGRLLTKRIEAEKFAPAAANAVAQPFNRANQKLVDTVPAYAQAKNAFAEARAGNPAALKTALIAYAGVADPKAQLRQGIINMVSQVDPSIKGSFDLALDRLTSGKLPPRIITDMEQMVDRLHATNRALYDQRRQAFVRSVPQAEPYVPKTEDQFDVPGMGGGATTPSAPGGGNTFTVNGKTYTLPGGTP